MNHAHSPETHFSFKDQAGTLYTRACYWDSLYAFKYGQERILVAERVVPHTNLHEALYNAFRSEQGDTLSHRLLPEFLQTPLLSVTQKGRSIEPFVQSVSALIPAQDQTLSQEVLAETEKHLEEIASQTLIARGIEGGLGSFDTNEIAPFLSDDGQLGNTLFAATSPTDREDKQLIALSVHVDAAIKAHMRTLMKEEALTLHGDPEFDLSARLYNNPRYLAYVRRLLKAKGSYASPVVRDFLSFYSRCLNQKLNAHAQETQTDLGTVKKRLESTLGHEKSGAHHAFDYHALTILGFVTSGELHPDPEDPDHTDHSFKLDPITNLESIYLCEILDKRFLIQKFVHHTFNTHHNVRNVTYIDETDAPPKAPQIVPEPIEKAIHQTTKRLDKWLGVNKTKIMSAAIGWVIFALILTLGIVVYSFFSMSNGG